MENVKIGLRSHDVHSGLRNVDPNSSTLIPLADTRIVGMAAGLASTIRGQDVITDADSLKSIVADQLDISPYAFPEVIKTLERADMISVQRGRNGRVVSLTETVPFHQDLYERLGAAWSENTPSVFESETLAIIDRLAKSPVPAEDLEKELGLERADIPRLLEIGKSASLIKGLNTIDGEVLYSPFFGFENPELLGDLFEKYGSGRVSEELAKVREFQGLPFQDAQYPALADAVSRGFIMAPSVTLPDGKDQPFATLPYVTDANLLTVRRPVLDKALAVIACIRTGELFGGATNARSPYSVLSALLDPNRDYTLGAHSSHSRQYQLLFRLQIVDFVPSGNWVRPKLIVTEDNLEAVRLARDLLTYGEPMLDRAGEHDARALLTLNSPYQTPLQTVSRRRKKLMFSDKEYRDVLDAAMGRSVL